MRYTSATLAFLLLSHSVGALAGPRNVEEDAIREVMKRWDSAWNSHDMQTLATSLNDDADFVNVAAEIHVRAYLHGRS